MALAHLAGAGVRKLQRTFNLKPDAAAEAATFKCASHQVELQQMHGGEKSPILDRVLEAVLAL
jgi:hypothetical protein